MLSVQEALDNIVFGLVLFTSDLLLRDRYLFGALRFVLLAGRDLAEAGGGSLVAKSL